jgi:hypothetical protein
VTLTRNGWSCLPSWPEPPFHVGRPNLVSLKNIAIMAAVAGAVYFGIEHYKTVKGK